jgi:hypothetical protein
MNDCRRHGIERYIVEVADLDLEVVSRYVLYTCVGDLGGISFKGISLLPEGKKYYYQRIA